MQRQSPYPVFGRPRVSRSQSPGNPAVAGFMGAGLFREVARRRSASMVAERNLGGDVPHPRERQFAIGKTRPGGKPRSVQYGPEGAADGSSSVRRMPLDIEIAQLRQMTAQPPPHAKTVVTPRAPAASRARILCGRSALGLKARTRSVDSRPAGYRQDGEPLAPPFGVGVLVARDALLTTRLTAYAVDPEHAAGAHDTRGRCRGAVESRRSARPRPDGAPRSAGALRRATSLVRDARLVTVASVAHHPLVVGALTMGWPLTIVWWGRSGVFSATAECGCSGGLDMGAQDALRQRRAGDD